MAFFCGLFCLFICRLFLSFGAQQRFFYALFSVKLLLQTLMVELTQRCFPYEFPGWRFRIGNSMCSIKLNWVCAQTEKSPVYVIHCSVVILIHNLQTGTKKNLHTKWPLTKAQIHNRFREVWSNSLKTASKSFKQNNIICTYMSSEKKICLIEFIRVFLFRNFKIKIHSFVCRNELVIKQ